MTGCIICDVNETRSWISSPASTIRVSVNEKFGCSCSDVCGFRCTEATNYVLWLKQRWLAGMRCFWRCYANWSEIVGARGSGRSWKWEIVGYAWARLTADAADWPTAIFYQGAAAEHVSCGNPLRALCIRCTFLRCPPRSLFFITRA